MLLDVIIWSKFHLSAGTSWFIYGYTKEHKDLISSQLPVGLAEADIGSFLEAHRIERIVRLKLNLDKMFKNKP